MTETNDRPVLIEYLFLVTTNSQANPAMPSVPEAVIRAISALGLDVEQVEVAEKSPVDGSAVTE